MKAVRISEHGDLSVLNVESVPVPDVGNDEVLVKIASSSVTWWDVSYRKGIVRSPPGRPPLPMPFQLGREGVGRVAAVGTSVTRFCIGQRVVIMTCPACGDCFFCRRGQDNICTSIVLPGHQRFGTHAEYFAAPESGLLAAPEGVPDDKLACMLWSYATVLHMMENRAKLQPGESVLVTGASGGMGTAALQLAKLAGAYPVIALTGSPDKYDDLRNYGADVVLNYHDTNILPQIRNLTEGLGVDVVFDNVGGAMASLGIDAARLGGRVVLAAVMAGRTIELDIAKVFGKHLDILGSRAATRCEQAKILKLAASGQVEPYIGAKFRLEEVKQAHEMVESGKHIGKVLLTMESTG